MTDGTSQGLFIVVAIVIFGIFVSLSYTVFGSGGLTTSIVELTEQATQKTELDNHKGEVIYAAESVRLVRELDGSDEHSSSTVFHSSMFEQDGEYTLEFYLTLNAGNLTHLGGHYHIGDISEVIVGNERHNLSYQGLENPWRYGVGFVNAFEIGETRKVTAHFVMDRYDTPTNDNKNLFISPQRAVDDRVYDVTITNLIFYKTN